MAQHLLVVVENIGGQRPATLASVQLIPKGDQVNLEVKVQGGGRRVLSMPPEGIALHAAARALLMAAEVDAKTVRGWLAKPKACKNGHIRPAGVRGGCRICMATRKVDRLEKQLAEARKAAAAVAA